MRRFFVTDPDAGQLPGHEAHHCAVVLRAEPGDRVNLFDGRGTEILATLTHVSPQKVTYRIDSRHRTLRPPGTLTLIQALPKNKSMDLIIQKATELGVTRIQPLLSERSVVRLNDQEAETKLEKWRQITIESAKQCGQNWLPEVLPARQAREFFQHRPAHHAAFIGSLQPGARTFRHWLADITAQLGRPPADLAICIGPEGDFSPAEMASANSAGYLPVTLGPIILRSETAAIYSLSVLNYELQNSHMPA